MTDTPLKIIEEKLPDGTFCFRSNCGGTSYTLTTTHEAALAERDARIAELEGALRAIATYREKCQEYDDDMGHERRDFDGDGWWQIEHVATAALSPPDPMKPLQDAGNG